jgi:hypothetical protein
MCGDTTPFPPYACLACTRRNFPSAFYLHSTFYQAVSTRHLFSEKASPLFVLISGLLADVQYFDPYKRVATAEARSTYFTSFPGFPFVLRHFSHYNQLICISFRITTFQASILLLLNHLCNVFFQNIQPCRPTFESCSLSLALSIICTISFSSPTILLTDLSEYADIFFNHKNTSQ